MKRLLHIMLFVGVFSNAFSQFDERLFFQLGGTIGADYTYSKGTIRMLDYKNHQINYASAMFAARMNFLELSNNMSMSLAVHPTISLGRAYNDQGGDGNISFRLPGFFEINFGAASTVATRKNTGFAIGVGAQYNKYPLLGGIPVAKDHNKQIHSVNATYIEPAMQMGVKFFGKHYFCREINLRASFASNTEINNGTKLNPDQTIQNYRSVGVMVSFLQYLNY